MRNSETVKALVDYARQLDAPPKYHCRDRIKSRGDALVKPISWTGRQWAVTAYGIQCRDGRYSIARERLWESEQEHGWVAHMSEKNWIDLRDFAEALRVARRLTCSV